MNTTATTDKGNTYEVVEYVDPFPGRKGDERIYETCSRCNGRGTINWGNVTFVAKGVEDRHCFLCLGSGQTSAKVSSHRAAARKAAKFQTAENARMADWEAEAPIREAERIAAEEAAQRKEEERQAAKPKGHIGEVGQRIKGLNAQVTMIRLYESQNYVTGAPEHKTIVKFDILGKVAVWFTSYVTGIEEGDFVTLTGTVKAHNNRDGEDQTILSRCIVK